MTNPYFLYFNLSIPYNNDIKTFKDGLILVQYMKNEEYRNAKRKTKFGQLVAGTSYENFAINNQDNKINNDFIEKKKGSAKFSFAFIYNNEKYGIWTDLVNGKMYVSLDYDKNSPYVFALTLKDHTENTMLIKSARKYSAWKNFIINYNVR